MEIQYFNCCDFVFGHEITAASQHNAYFSQYFINVNKLPEGGYIKQLKHVAVQHCYEIKNAVWTIQFIYCIVNTLPQHNKDAVIQIFLYTYFYIYIYIYMYTIDCSVQITHSPMIDTSFINTTEWSYLNDCTPQFWQILL